MKTYIINGKLVKASNVILPTKKTEEVSKKAEEVVVESEVIDSDLSKHTVKELKAMAKELGLKGYSKLKEGELIDLIESAQDESEEL